MKKNKIKEQKEFPIFSDPSTVSDSSTVSKSTQGFKSSKFGQFFWTVYHHISYAKKELHPTYLYKFYTSPQDIVPCIFCRQSYTKFLTQYPIEPYLAKNKIPYFNWEIHNCVNRKLNKTEYEYSVCKKRYTKVKPEEFLLHYWIFLFMITLNFPAQINFSPYDTIKTRQKALNKLDKALQHRYTAYITFFQQQKNLLPQDHPLNSQWSNYYFKYPPTIQTFSNRQTLFNWVYKIAYKTNFWPETQKQTLKMIEYYRAGSCSKVKKACI